MSMIRMSDLRGLGQAPQAELDAAKANMTALWDRVMPAKATLDATTDPYQRQQAQTAFDQAYAEYNTAKTNYTNLLSQPAGTTTAATPGIFSQITSAITPTTYGTTPTPGVSATPPPPALTSDQQALVNDALYSSNHLDIPSRISKLQNALNVVQPVLAQLQSQPPQGGFFSAFNFNNPLRQLRKLDRTIRNQIRILEVKQNPQAAMQTQQALRAAGLSVKGGGMRRGLGRRRRWSGNRWM